MKRIGISENRNKRFKNGTNGGKHYGKGCSVHVGQCPNVLLQTSPFFKIKSLKGLQKFLRSKWVRGPFTKFDEFLCKVAKIDLATAQKIRESWEDLGILAYDKRDF